MLAKECKKYNIWVIMSDLTIRHSPALFDNLPARLVTRLIEVANIVRYDDRQLIHNRGDGKPGLSVIRSGAARVGVYGADGAFIMTTILEPGHSFGEVTVFTDLQRTHDIAAAGPTEVYTLSAARFNRLTEEEPAFLRAVLVCSLVRSHMALERLDAISRLATLERTAYMLCSLAPAGEDAAVIHYRQSDLAFTLGVSRVTLNQTLKTLTELGLIVPGYGRIKLVSRAGLENWLAARGDLPRRL